MNPNEINDLRRRVLAKEHVSAEELAAALSALRQGRATAAQQSAAAKRKSGPKTEAEATEQLDDILGSIGL